MEPLPERQQRLGFALGFLAILSFSLTLPATKAAIPTFGGWTIGMGRAVIAASLAAPLLAISRTPKPKRDQMRSLMLVAGGVVLGFPVFTALALEHVPATRGAIVVGLLPASTALVAAIRHGERPGLRFWLAAAGGLLTVLAFAILSGSRGRPEPADILLAAAVLAAAIGYAEGAELAKSMGSWQTICWALVLSLPVTLPAATVAMRSHGVVDLDTGAVAGFAYVSVVSMLLGFFAWYAALTMGGVARVSQIQLVQPILTLGWAWALLDETVEPGALLAAIGVVVFVWLARRSSVSSNS